MNVADLAVVDSESSCPKCGAGRGQVKMRWHAGGFYGSRLLLSGRSECCRSVADENQIPSHMSRSCDQCGHSWAERPLDYEEDS